MLIIPTLRWRPLHGNTVQPRPVESSYPQMYSAMNWTTVRNCKVPADHDTECVQLLQVCNDFLAFMIPLPPLRGSLMEHARVRRILVRPHFWSSRVGIMRQGVEHHKEYSILHVRALCHHDLVSTGLDVGISEQHYLHHRKPFLRIPSNLILWCESQLLGVMWFAVDRFRSGQRPDIDSRSVVLVAQTSQSKSHCVSSSSGDKNSEPELPIVRELETKAPDRSRQCVSINPSARPSQARTIQYIQAGGA